MLCNQTGHRLKDLISDFLFLFKFTAYRISFGKSEKIRLVGPRRKYYVCLSLGWSRC